VSICGHCLRAPPAYVSSFSPFHYAPPVASLITALKFHGRLSLARLLGELMAATLTTRAEPLPELLIPVPLHQTRLRERGYNQALELARPIGRLWHIPVEPWRCHRVRATLAQTRLSERERRLNVRDAFHVDGPLQARCVAIVDDVMTTGSTAQELTLALMAAGVERVEVWTCARAALASSS
jgi:ComF family protein